MSPRIAALATHLGPDRSEHGVAIEPDHDEISMAIKVAREVSFRLPESSRSFDSIIFASSGIRHIFPGGGAAIAEALGLSCQAFDVTAGCASMSLALEIGARMNGTVLVVCSDLLSRTIDPLDPAHAPLRSFGDGAAAAVISRDGPGPRILAHGGRTLGRWRGFYGSKDGKLLRSIPAGEKRDLSAAYLGCWTEIGRELLSRCPAGAVPWVYASQGDAKLFPQLMRSLGLPEDRVVRTGHGHAGGADPWIAIQAAPPPPGSFALVLASGIGFTFHGTLLEMA
jgi:3-oxoacyl-[acyl-carrier-protein] synthase III